MKQGLIAFPRRRLVTASALSVTYIGTYDTGTAATSFSNSFDFGAADADLLCLVTYSGTAGAARSYSSSTIGGSAATSYVTVTNGTTQCCIAGVVALKVAGGGSQTVQVNFSGNLTACVLNAYRVLTTQATAAADYDTGTATGTASPQATLDSPAGGAIIAVCTTGASVSATGTAFTEADIEDVETTTSDGSCSSSSVRKATPTLASSQTMTAVLSGSPSNAVVAAVSISP